MLRDIQSKLRSRELTSKALVESSLSKIDEKDSGFGSFLSVFRDKSIESAEKIDVLYENGDDLPDLAGVPIGIKDNIHIFGEKSTCASKMLENFVAPFDATVTKKLQDNMMIPVGKLNMDEFAMGSSTENSAFGPTRNPWNTDCVPGGSSGGSAVAVAADLVPLSLGSDTGGSIRQPASLCGVVGMKPSYGRVSRYGLVAFASSLDQIGPFAHTVEDAALLLNAICGHDPFDSTSVNIPVPDFTANLNKDISGLKIGVPEELMSDQIDAEVRGRVAGALDVLKNAGATWETFSFKGIAEALSAYYILAPAEASANLARYDGVRYGHRAEAATLREMYTKTRSEGFGDEVKRRIVLGTFVLSSGYYDAYYLKAQKLRTVIIDEFRKAFSNYDVIATPTSPTVAFKIGEVSDPYQMYLADIATIPVNLAGLPGISIPCGFSKDLPVGLQLIGDMFDEPKILNVGHQYQQLTDFHARRPV